MIVFTTPIDEDVLKMAYNNNIIKFATEETQAPLYCHMDGGFSVTLYPGPDNSFYYNFKDIIASRINTNNFEDHQITNIINSEPASFIYESTSGSYLYTTISIEIGFPGNIYQSTNLQIHWLAGVEQLGENRKFKIEDVFIMSPIYGLSNNINYLKYWQGYPFDISIYNGSQQLKVYHNSNQLELNFDNVARVSRLFISDGRTDESLEDILPLFEGLNSITISNNNTDEFHLSLQKVAYKCGVYIKWFNKYGGYNYWLFEDTSSIDRTIKSLGELDRDFSNPNETFTRAIQIGKESQDTIRVTAELLSEEERSIVAGIMDSPKIYLFTGQPFSRAFPENWVEISLKTSSARIKNPKQQLTNFVFDFDLPQRYTQTL